MKVGEGNGNPFSNMCHSPPPAAGGTLTCAMTQPGGYCDPDGDGSYSDGDWDRGWQEFQAHCL